QIEISGKSGSNKMTELRVVKRLPPGINGHDCRVASVLVLEAGGNRGWFLDCGLMEAASGYEEHKYNAKDDFPGRLFILHGASRPAVR
ncbi:MAG: hypothetical protein DRG80_00805, partial [Deltaproteobacteria bacterium]